MLNKCSKHRRLFRPPPTPEKFWDPLVVEDDTQDPRNKTQVAPALRNRAQIKADDKERRRGGMGRWGRGWATSEVVRNYLRSMILRKFC